MPRTSKRNLTVPTLDNFSPALRERLPDIILAWQQEATAANAEIEPDCQRIRTAYRGAVLSMLALHDLGSEMEAAIAKLMLFDLAPAKKRNQRRVR